MNALLKKKDDEFPYLSIIIPVRNEERFIENTISLILDQDYPRDKMEIIVVDGMSEDRTCEVVAEVSDKSPSVKLLYNPRRLSSEGRNIGIKNSRGEIIVFIDGHCWIEERVLLKNIVECFRKSEADCLCRPQPLDTPNATLFQKAVSIARSSAIGHGYGSLIYSGKEGFVDPTSSGAIYRREVFAKVGFFDQEFDACEDVEFNYRVKKNRLKSYTSPKLKVDYYARGNLKDLYRQMKRYGSGRFKFIKKHPEAFSVNQIIPAGFVTLMFLSFFLGIFKSFFLKIPFLIIGIYCLLVFVFAFFFSIRRGVRFFITIVGIYWVIHFGLAMGFLSALFSHLAKSIKSA